MPIRAGVPTKPVTGAEWRDHAEDLHRRGLEIIDTVSGLRDVPAEVSQAYALHAQAFFFAAQSAIAMATHLTEWSTSA